MYRLDRFQSQRSVVDFKQNSTEGNCFTVIIGNNGTGKSRLLGEIARSETNLGPDSHRGYGKGPNMLLAISNLVTDNFPFPQRPIHNYRYLGLRQASNAMTTGAITASLAQHLAEITIAEKATFDVNRITRYMGIPDASLRVTFSKPEETSGKTNRKVQQIVDTHGRASTWKDLEILHSQVSIIAHDDATAPHLVNSIRADEIYALDEDRKSKGENEPSSSDLVVSTLAKSIRKIDSFRNISNQDLVTLLQKYFGMKLRVDFGETQDSLSGGQALLLSMILRLMANIEPSSLILIDEPETGLHPEWQSDLIRLINSFIPHEFGCHFLIATHSPYIAASATNILTPNSDNGFSEMETDHRGMSIESLIYKVFETRVIGSHSVEKDLTTVMNWMSSGEAVVETAVTDAVRRLKAVSNKDSPTLNSIIDEFENIATEAP